MKILKGISILTGFIFFMILIVVPFMYESDSLDFGQAVQIIALSTVVVIASRFTYMILKEKSLEGRQPRQGTNKNNQANYSKLNNNCKQF